MIMLTFFAFEKKRRERERDIERRIGVVFILLRVIRFGDTTSIQIFQLSNKDGDNL